MPKLVRVKPEGRSLGDTELLEDHGYLWFEDDDEESDAGVDGLKFYRSLATQYEYLWYDYEIEELNDG